MFKGIITAVLMFTIGTVLAFKAHAQANLMCQNSAGVWAPCSTSNPLATTGPAWVPSVLPGSSGALLYNNNGALDALPLSARGQFRLPMTIDATVVGTLPVNTMVGITDTGTVSNQLGPVQETASTVTLSATTALATFPLSFGGGAFGFVLSDTTDSNKIKIGACTTSGAAPSTTISCGALATISASTATDFHATVMSSTQMAVIFHDTANSNKPTAVACSRSGNVMTCGSAVAVSNSTDTTNGYFAASTSATEFLASFIDTTDTSKLKMVACSIAANVLTCGTPVAVVGTGSPTTGGGAFTALSATSFIYAFRDSTNGNNISAVAGSLAGNVITFGTAVNTASSTGVALATLDGTHAVLGTAALARALLVSGTTLTAGSTAALSTSLANPALFDFAGYNVFVEDANHVEFASADRCTTSADTVIACVSINSVSTYTYASLAQLYLSSSASVSPQSTSIVDFSFSPTSYYRSPSMSISGATSQGRAAILNSTQVASIYGVSGTGIQASVVDTYPVKLTGVIGVSQAAGTAGQTIDVAIGGLITGLSGLGVGKITCTNGLGVISTPTNCALVNGVGIAVTTTSMMMGVPTAYLTSAPSTPQGVFQ